MANQEHLEVLKQGVAAWNRWRKEHPEIRPDLSRADLGTADLVEADFSFTDLREADLFDANLGNTDLFGANLRDANLFGVVLSGADLREADFTGTKLNKANLSRAILDRTTFGDVDLHEVTGLETIWHLGPSTIGVDTIYHSKGHILASFLRKAGLPPSFLDSIPYLVMKWTDYSTCFISYSDKDHTFAEQLYDDLQNEGVRCWFAPEDMKIGDNIHTRIDESIRLYDKLLLVLSAHSLKSTWVEREVVAAFEKEQQQDQQVLFPIRLDETVMQTSEAWAADIRRRKHIGDFTRWKQHDDYQQAFERLLRDLKAEV